MNIGVEPKQRYLPAMWKAAW